MSFIYDADDPRKYEFYFVRHGECVSNVNKVVSGGKVDCELTEKGISQSHAVGKFLESLSEEKPLTIISSPQKRALSTAHIINSYLNIPFYKCDDLKEHDLGDWEGKPGHPNWSDHFENKISPPNGETYSQFYSRAYRALKFACGTSSCPLIVSHAGMWHALKALVGDFSTEWLTNASAYRAIIAKDAPSPFLRTKIFEA
jgi:broad specificity phosphatase PhoE